MTENNPSSVSEDLSDSAVTQLHTVRNSACTLSGEQVRSTPHRLEEVGGPQVSELIRVCRIRSGLSARQLSSLADLSPSYITKLEAGEIEPGLRSFSRIAVVLRMTSQEIRLCIALASR